MNRMGARQISFQVSVDDEGFITITSQGLEASGFSTGSVLFHAFRKLCMEQNDLDPDEFNTVVSDAYKSFQVLDDIVVSEFRRLHQRWNDSRLTRKTIFNWSAPNESMGSWWSNVIELVMIDDVPHVLFAVHQGDFEIDGMGWDSADDQRSILHQAVLKLDEYRSQEEDLVWNMLIEKGVVDETGKFALLIDPIGSEADLCRLPQYLLTEECGNILDEQIYSELTAAMRLAFIELP